MDTATPTKPPRANKSGKETGILMTVIKTLSTSASTDHRDREKAKLEKEFKRSEQRLEGLVSEHQEPLSNVMNTFKKACDEIDGSKKRLKDVKSHLMNCKKLLHGRRDELERLWLEWVEHKHALELLEKVEKLRSTSENHGKLIHRKQYLAASEALMACFDCWDETLDSMEGLKETHMDLKNKEEKLYELLKGELYNEFYQRWYTTAIEMKKQGIGSFNPFERSSSERRSSGRQKMTMLKAKKFYIGVPGENQTDKTNGFDHGLMNESEDLDDETEKLFAEIVKCVICLKRVPKMVEGIKRQMEEKLLGIVNHTSQQIIEYGDANGVSETDATLLSDLLLTLFTQFKFVVKAHSLFLSYLNKGLQEYNMSLNNVYSEDYVWNKVQAVLMSTLKIYFALGDSKSHSSRVTSGSNYRELNNNNDLSSFFQRKRAPRQKKEPLFKFEYSLHGLNTQYFMNSNNSLDRSLIDKHRLLVCKENPRNILAVQESLQRFMTEVELACGGQKCELRKFMRNNVHSVFIQQLYKDISESIDAARKNPDTWQDTTSVEEAKNLSVPRPLLQSVVQIGRSVKEVISLSHDLPDHNDELIKVLDSLLVQYKDVCQDAYKTFVQPNPNEKGLLSAVWVRDDDIQRFLKSLPNWSKLLRRREKKMESFDESPEDLRAQNVRESELLCGEFGAKIILPHEILSDVKQLRYMAHLHESLEWFSGIVKKVVEAFVKNVTLEPDLKPALKKLNVLSQNFQDIANQCLLLLHLEVRIHCFFYVLPVMNRGEFSPGVDTQKSDPEVVQLCRDLYNISEALNTALQPMKCKYVFEGVGHLVCTVFLNGSSEIKRINDNGVKRICRDIFELQKILSKITGQPEHSLDHAKFYYELFSQTPEDLFNSILEKGPQFKEMEYVNALKLLYRSKPGLKDEDLSADMSRLSNILGDVGVTV